MIDKINKFYKNSDGTILWVVGIIDEYCEYNDKKWLLVDEDGDCVWTKVTIPACFDTTKGGLLFYSFNSKHYSIIPSDNYKMDDDRIQFDSNTFFDPLFTLVTDPIKLGVILLKIKRNICLYSINEYEENSPFEYKTVRDYLFKDHIVVFFDKEHHVKVCADIRLFPVNFNKSGKIKVVYDGKEQYIDYFIDGDPNTDSDVVFRIDGQEYRSPIGSLYAYDRDNDFYIMHSLELEYILGKTSVDRVRGVLEYGIYYSKVREHGYPKSDPVQALSGMCSAISPFEGVEID